MTISQPQTFEPDGRAVPFIEEGDGPVRVVLLPARGLDISSLGTLAHVLEEEGFHLLRIGVRRGPHAAVTLHDLAQDVADVMAHVGFSSSWIAGHGAGGSLARVVALDHADLVEGVVLLGVETEGGTGAEARRAIDTVLAGADEEIELEAAAVLGGDAEAAFSRNVLVRHLDAAGASVYDEALAATPVADWAQLGQNYAVLVVQGSADRLNSLEQAQELQRSAPERVSLTVVEGAGHLGVLTHAGEVGFGVEDYLAWD